MMLDDDYELRERMRESIRRLQQKDRSRNERRLTSNRAKVWAIIDNSVCREIIELSNGDAIFAFAKEIVKKALRNNS